MNRGKKKKEPSYKDLWIIGPAAPKLSWPRTCFRKRHKVGKKAYSPTDGRQLMEPTDACDSGVAEHLWNRCVKSIPLLIAPFVAKKTFHFTKRCVLPPYPEHGRYSVASAPEAGPGTALDSAFFTTACDPGYYVDGNSYVFCSQGFWGNEVAPCRHCGNVEPDDKAVKKDVRREAPWHVTLYQSIPPEREVIYTQICAGTLITASTIISSAQCVWWASRERTVPPDTIFAAVGSRQRSWNASDSDFQSSAVNNIRVPFRFSGRWSNYQDDISIMVVNTPFEFTPVVKPACIDFDLAMEHRHLSNRNTGTVSVWQGEDMETPFTILNVTAVDNDSCFAEALSFTATLTSDKLCGNFPTDTLIPKHSLGAGLVFPEVIDGVTYYYLRGVVATRPDNFNSSTWLALTRVQNHDQLIMKQIVY